MKTLVSVTTLLTFSQERKTCVWQKFLLSANCYMNMKLQTAKQLPQFGRSPYPPMCCSCPICHLLNQTVTCSLLLPDLHPLPSTPQLSALGFYHEVEIIPFHPSSTPLSALCHTGHIYFSPDNSCLFAFLFFKRDKLNDPVQVVRRHRCCSLCFVADSNYLPDQNLCHCSPINQSCTSMPRRLVKETRFPSAAPSWTYYWSQWATNRLQILLCHFAPILINLIKWLIS